MKCKKEDGMKAVNVKWMVGLVLVLAWMGASAQQKKGDEIELGVAGKASAYIVLKAKGEPARFAAGELSKYLGQMTGAAFHIVKKEAGPMAFIRLDIDSTLPLETYRIEPVQGGVMIAGGSGRALLYGVYGMLNHLGCRWPVPALPCYGAAHEYIPHPAKLVFALRDTVTQSPAMAFRKLDVEEGRSHTAASLLALIDWMPRCGFNTLMVPLDYGGMGRVRWDNWRKVLTPELKKRGLLIEVGGHGYQNFLNASMEGGRLFKEHPEWFGRDSDCNPTPKEYEVFNTASPEAVRYLTAHVVSYLRAHPEIDIFDFWPPDVARWNDCSEEAALGPIADRQARLVNAVDSAVHASCPGVRLEIIAYAMALLPPQQVQLRPDVLVDFCPIDQTYEDHIYDASSPRNKVYADALKAWRKSFAGDIGLYSYYRKYAWHSLPNVIPHYIADEVRWYAGIPLQGVSVYCEPGDWATYALNTYMLGKVAWNPNLNMDSLIGQFCRALYHDEAPLAARVYSVLEQTVRHTGHIPFTSRKSPQQLSEAMAKLEGCSHEIDSVTQALGNGTSAANLRKLALSVKYASLDLSILAAGKDTALAKSRVASLYRFLASNRNQGLFLIRPTDDQKRYERYYGL